MLGFVPFARVTFVIDKDGIVRWDHPQCNGTNLNEISSISKILNSTSSRDALDATVNYGAHTKFVAKWLDKLDEEDKAAIKPEPTAEVPKRAAVEKCVGGWGPDIGSEHDTRCMILDDGVYLYEASVPPGVVEARFQLGWIQVKEMY